VAANGTPRGDGSFERPWNLQTALAHPPSVTPGSTIWVRGGTHRGAFTSRLTGSASAPVIVRNYQGERVTIDNPTDCDGITLNGSYTWYWGLEIMSSGTKRATPYAGSHCAEPSDVHLDRGIGVRNNGSFNKIINCVIHDNQQGIGNWGTWTSGPGLEIYGTLIYYNGGQQTGGARDGWGIGHGTYLLSKQTGETKVIDNIVFANFVTGIRLGDDGVFKPHVEGNISFINGDNMKPGGRNISVMGLNGYGTPGYAPMTDAIIRNNYTYYPVARWPSSGAGNVGASESIHPGLWAPNSTGEIVGNYIAGPFPSPDSQPTPFLLGYWDHFNPTRCRDNFIYGTDIRPYVKERCPTTVNTYGDGKPASNAVFTRPNLYERGRAHIAIYNWQHAPSVDIDLAASGLVPGQPFEVRDAMDFYGPPLVRGLYAANQPISIRMHGLMRAALMGETDISSMYRPQHTAPEFGSFVVVPNAHLESAPPPVSPQPPPPAPIPPPLPTPGPIPAPLPDPYPILEPLAKRDAIVARGQALIAESHVVTRMLKEPPRYSGTTTVKPQR
jgi:hypothetical protein